MKKQKIIFRAADQIYECEDPPVPAKKTIPQWFKDIPHEDKTFGGDLRDNATVKKCMPFFDSLTAGYMVTVPQDIAITKTEYGGKKSYWGYINQGADLVMDYDRPEHRTKGMPTPEGYEDGIWRMIVYPRIYTPKGYSVLVTHPFNRYDLPFLSLTGIIDTDSIHTRLAISMYLKKDFEGVIEKGTPVAQIFPFKREDWTHEVLPSLDKLETQKEDFKIRSVMNRSYMRQFWHKKTYE
jgi:hypothetical protein